MLSTIRKSLHRRRRNQVHLKVGSEVELDGLSYIISAYYISSGAIGEQLLSIDFCPRDEWHRRLFWGSSRIWN